MFRFDLTAIAATSYTTETIQKNRFRTELYFLTLKLKRFRKSSKPKEANLMFFDPAIVSTLKLKEANTQEDKPTRALALVPTKERNAKRSRKQRRLGFNLKRQA
jgi:hypothetical protein